MKHSEVTIAKLYAPEYDAPEGTEAKTIPVKRSFEDRTYYCLYSISLGHTYGTQKATYEEAKAGADKENIRMASYVRVSK